MCSLHFRTTCAVRTKYYLYLSLIYKPVIRTLLPLQVRIVSLEAVFIPWEYGILSCTSDPAELLQASMTALCASVADARLNPISAD